MTEERNVKHYLLLPDGSYTELDTTLVVSIDHDVVVSDEQLNTTMDKVYAWVDEQPDEPEDRETPIAPPAEGVVAVGEVGVRLTTRAPSSERLH